MSSRVSTCYSPVSVLRTVEPETVWRRDAGTTSQSPRVVRPVQQRLPLPATAVEVAIRTVLQDLGDVSRHRAAQTLAEPHALLKLLEEPPADTFVGGKVPFHADSKQHAQQHSQERVYHIKFRR